MKNNYSSFPASSVPEGGILQFLAYLFMGTVAWCGTSAAIVGASNTFENLVVEDEVEYQTFLAKHVTQGEAEALFAVARAAVYWPSKGEVALLLEAEARLEKGDTKVLVLSADAELICCVASKWICDFAVEIVRELEVRSKSRQDKGEAVTRLST